MVQIGRLAQNAPGRITFGFDHQALGPDQQFFGAFNVLPDAVTAMLRPGRARQQNCGAAAAKGENLLFLHADTRLPEGYVSQVFETLMAPWPVMGAFRFKTDFRSPLMRLVEWVTHLRSRYLRLPYGDQAIFMKKSIFEKAGGFPVVPIGEDLFLVRHLRKHENVQVAMAAGAVVTSGRRWKTLGPLKTTWINQLMLMGMAMGISLQTLSRLYRRSS